jgi:prepilin-type N-terminal cleavage/methylation domain-containing protein
MKTGKAKTRGAFTLIELLVVIAIIGILAGLLLPAIHRAQMAARKAKCVEQLHQFAVALETYRGAYDGNPPPWLSNLYPKTIANERLYLCPEDSTKGKDGGKPAYENNPGTAFLETDDFSGSPAHSATDPDSAGFQNPNLPGNSYLYEFCCAECSWWDPGYSWNGHNCDFASNYVPDPTIHASGRGTLTWREVKEWETKYVGAWTPIVRCFWHTGGTFLQQDQVLNLGTQTYHVYISDTTGDGWKTSGNK